MEDSMHRIPAFIVVMLALGIASVTPASAQGTSQKSGFSMEKCMATCQKSTIAQSCEQYCQRMSRTNR
jgi:hypothetical protein